MSTVEDVLREIIDRAAMLQYLANSAMLNQEPPDSEVLSGIGDVCGEIYTRARGVRAALSAAALNQHVAID